MFSAFDERDDQSLPGRYIDAVDETLQEAQANQPRGIDLAAQSQGCQSEGLEHGENLSEHEQAMAIDAIDPNARERREEENRRLVGEADYAQQKGRGTEVI